MNQAGVIAQQIYVAVAINVPQEWPLAARYRERIRAMVSGGAGIASGHHAFGTLREVGGFGSPFLKTLFDRIHGLIMMWLILGPAQITLRSTGRSGLDFDDLENLACQGVRQVRACLLHKGVYGPSRSFLGAHARHGVASFS